MIIILVGKSGAGKSSLMSYMIDRLDFLLPKWYTTRAPRNDPADKVYNFLTPIKYLEMQKEGLLNNCNVLYGSLYATVFDDYKDKNYVSVMDVEGLWKAKRAYGKHVVGVFLECPEEERAYRMLMRGDKPEHVTYRLGKDRTMFKNVFHIADYKITSATPKDDVTEMLDIIRDIEEEKGVKLIEI